MATYGHRILYSSGRKNVTKLNLRFVKQTLWLSSRVKAVAIFCNVGFPLVVCYFPLEKFDLFEFNKKERISMNFKT